jgi:hypothetical protein
MNWDQVATVGQGRAAVATSIAAPYGEELWRCAAARKR